MQGTLFVAGIITVMSFSGRETWTKPKKHLCYPVLDIVSPLMFWLVSYSVTQCVTCQ